MYVPFNKYTRGERCCLLLMARWLPSQGLIFIRCYDTMRLFDGIITSGRNKNLQEPVCQVWLLNA